jgi:hypothetical protein
MQIKTSYLAMLVILVGSISITSVYASSDDPYDSGYSHGCDDADLDADDRYINEPGKGPSHHTERFMDGYNAGFDDCRNGDSNGNDGSSSSGRNREDLAEELCDLLDENRGAAVVIATMLGYPGLDVAASALCDVSGN